MTTSPAPLSLLSRTERFWYAVADLFARRLWRVSVLWNHVFMVNVVRLLGGRRLHAHGLEHLAAVAPGDRIVMVANHRSFFDFFTIGGTLYMRTHVPRRLLFPVRAPFFYDRWIGGFVNAFMSAFTMFPPIVRDTERQDWNRYALVRCVEALAVPGTVVGFHPEGTRNQGPDPYELLRPHPGVGKVILEAPDVKVLPVFVLGPTNSVFTDFVRNWTHPGAHPIDVVFGPPVDVTDLRAKGSRATTQMAVAKRCLDAIAALGAQHRALRGPPAPSAGPASDASPS